MMGQVFKVAGIRDSVRALMTCNSLIYTLNT
ncbi:Uncharacterised protein [Yersinia massiliensis]|nr:Uncharacterised protein [Yersinia massiliensis]